MVRKTKVGILGVGNVGSHCAYALAATSACDEVVLMDINGGKAYSEALDISDAALYLPTKTKVRAGQLEDEVKDMDILVVSFGKKPEPDQDRLDMLKDTVEMVQQEIPKIIANGFQGIFIVISNPVDMVTQVVQKISGFPKNRVFGTGTGMDSARLRQILSDETGISGESIEGIMMGEHGFSQMTPWSQVRVAGLPIVEALDKGIISLNGKTVENITEEARQRGYAILEGKGCTEFGIGTTLSRFVRAIIKDEKVMIPASTLLEGEYEEKDVYAGVPVIIGADGVEEVLYWDLTPEELAAFHTSCEVIRKAFRTVN